MTTAADLVAGTKRYLTVGNRENLNKLNGGITDTATTLTVTYGLNRIQEGAVIGIGLELMRVWEANASTKVVTVQRGYLGSTAASHSDGALITVDSEFPDYAIFQAINDELAELSSPIHGLFQVGTKDITYNSAVASYDLGSDVLSVLEVRFKEPGAEKRWAQIRPTDYEVMRNMSTSEFTSGVGIRFNRGGYPGQTVRVRYRKAFTAMTALTDDVQSVAGLPATANDIPPMGAAIRVLAGAEVGRNTTSHQGDVRRAEEVPPGARAASTRELERRRAQRIAAEAARLAAQWPTQVG